MLLLSRAVLHVTDCDHVGSSVLMGYGDEGSEGLANLEKQ